MSPTTTSWTLIAVGALVSGIGYSLLPGRFGAGLLGFGLAHIMLGILDMFREAARNRYPVR